MARRRKRKKYNKSLCLIIIIILVLVYNTYGFEINSYVASLYNTYIDVDNTSSSDNDSTSNVTYTIEDIPSYSGSAYVTLNENIPTFTEDEITLTTFESYSDLDSLGRCGVAFALVGTETMPTEERGSIGVVKPTGWHTVKYDIVDGKYLYNRCHLIGYQLTGENANEKNLITCTRQMNVGAMLDYENLVALYVNDTGNHVLYRVTPIFEGDNLVATGVVMEGYSVEDEGAGVSFNIFVYNVQDGITIDYATGDSTLS